MESKQPRQRIAAAIDWRGKRFADHHGDGRLAQHCRCDRAEAAELQALLEAAYRRTAPKSLAAKLLG